MTTIAALDPVLVVILLSISIWKWGPQIWNKDSEPPSSSSASKASEDDLFQACKPTDVSVEMTDQGNSAQDTDVGSSLLFSAKDPEIVGNCLLTGFLTNLRFLTTTGEAFPVKAKQDDFKAPSKIPVGQGWVAEVDLRWKGENVPGVHVLPATLEFRLPGSNEPIRLPWRGGYINVGEPLYHSAAVPSGN